MKEEVFENPNIRILLVDDNRVNQFLGKRLLKNIGIENVDLCSNGIDALSKISEVKYDVLLTDIEMPEMNGLEFVAYLKKNHSNSLATIPIAFSSAYALKENQILPEGVFLMQKPFHLETLLYHINKITLI